VADLDDAELGRDALVGGDAERPLVGQLGQCEVEGVLCLLGPREHLAKVLGALVRAVWQVGPDLRVSLWRVRNGV
jgi:hypothetical protein